MTTPAKQTIIEAIEAGLANITAANGYKSTVATVERVIRNPDEVSAAQRPWVGFVPANTERYELEGPGHIRVTMSLYIGAHVQAATEDLVDAAVTNLQDDIIALMFSEPTFGESAVDVRIIDGHDDIGDSERDMGRGSEGFSGTFDQNWEVHYDRLTASS